MSKDQNTSKIVVTTPMGNVGSRVVRLLVQAGVRPTLLMRHPDRLAPELAAHVDVEAGDQLVADDVLRATAGADALFWVNPTDGTDPVAAYGRAAACVAAAVEEHGIARTVFQSSIGAEKREGAGEIDGLAHTELALDATGASVTHLRCGYFYTNLLLDPGALEEGVLRVVLPVDAPLPWVDPRDIGDVAAARLLSAAWSRRHVQAVHGPEDLSFAQAAAIVATATGRPLRAERIADDAMRARLRAAGMGDTLAEAVLGMSTGLRDDFVPENPRTVVTTTPTTLGAWAHEHLREPAT